MYLFLINWFHITPIVMKCSWYFIMNWVKNDKNWNRVRTIENRAYKKKGIRKTTPTSKISLRLGLGLWLGFRLGLVLGLGATRQLPGRKIDPVVRVRVWVSFGVGGGAIFFEGNWPITKEEHSSLIKYTLFIINWLIHKQPLLELLN